MCCVALSVHWCDTAAAYHYADQKQIGSDTTDPGRWIAQLVLAFIATDATSKQLHT